MNKTIDKFLFFNICFLYFFETNFIKIKLKKSTIFNNNWELEQHTISKYL